MSTTAARPRARSARAFLTGPRASVGAFALLAVFGLVVLWRKGVDTSFYFDDWDFILRRHTGDIGTFLEPHNEHFSLVPVAIYKFLFATVGIDSYSPYRAILDVLHVTVVTLLFIWARPRVGGVAAIGAAALLLFLGAGFQDIFWAFQMGFLAALATGLGGLILLQRETRRSDIAAMLLFGISLASASIGIPIVIGAVVYLAMRPTQWRRAWVIGVPVALYGIWYLKYGVSALDDKNITAAPAFTVEEYAGAVGAVVELALDWGRILAVAMAAGILWHVSRVKVIPRALVMALTVGFSFWLLTALARADLADPNAPRYLYPGALFVLLIGTEVLRGWRPRKRALWLLGVGVVLAVVSGFQTIDKGSDGLRETDQWVQAQLTAVDIGGEHMPPGLKIDSIRAPQVTVGPYLEAVRAIGTSPAYTEAELSSFEETRRQLADGAFVRGYELIAQPGIALPAGAAPVADPGFGRHVRTRGSCLVARQEGGSKLPQIAFTVPPGGMSLRAPGGSLRLRRFAGTFPGDPNVSGRLARAVVRIPGDRSARPWHALVVDARSLTVCGIGAGP